MTNDRPTLPLDLVREVADHLPGEWTVGDSNGWSATLTRTEDHRSLTASVTTYGTGAGRVTFRDGWNLDDLRYHEEKREITTAPTTKPSTVAKRIVSSILEPGEELHRTVLARRESHKNYVNATAETFESLPNVLRHTYGNDDPTRIKFSVNSTPDDCYASGNAHGSRVTLELNYLPADVAARILEMLA